MVGQEVPYQVLDPKARGKLDDHVPVAAKEDADRHAAEAAVKGYMPEFGVERLSDINSEAKLEDLVASKTTEISRDNSLDAAQKENKLKRLMEMEYHAKKYNELQRQTKLTSKAMGDIGAIAHILDPVARPGAVLLTPFDGFLDGANTIDVGAFLPAREPGPGDPGRAPTFVVNEAKGGTSTLKAADTPEGRAEQGAPEYLRRTLSIDQNLHRVLLETPRQMIERGLDLDSTEGKSYLQARNELLRAFADGTLQYEYKKIQVARDGTITETRFILERDGKPLSIDVIGRIDRELAREVLRTFEAEEKALGVERAVERARAVEMVQARVTHSIELATNRDLASIEQRIRDNLERENSRMSKREVRQLVREAEENIRYAHDKLLRFVDEAGRTLQPEVFEAWREGTVVTVIEVGRTSGTGQVVVIDRGPGLDPALVYPYSMERQLASIERLAGDGYGPTQISSQIKAFQQYTADFRLETHEQAVDRAKQIVTEGWQSHALNAARQAGRLTPETDAIREQAIDALNHATERELAAIHPYDVLGNQKKQEILAHAQALRIEVNDRILAGVEPDVHNAWSNATATISFEVTQDPIRMLTYVPIAPEDSSRLVPTESRERDLARITNDARNGRDLADIRKDLLVDRSTATAEFTVETREQALDRGRQVFPERQAVLDRVIRDLQRASAQHERAPGLQADVRWDPVIGLPVPVRDSGTAGRDLQQKVVEYVRAGFDPDVYHAWRDSARVLPINIEQNGRIEAMAILERDGHEPILTPMQSPERALALIAQRAELSRDPAQIEKALSRSGSEVPRLTVRSSEKAVELGREILEQARTVTREIDMLQERALAAERNDPGRSERGVDTRDQHIREQVQEIRETVERIITRGVDPKTVEKAREALDGRTENNLTVETGRDGRPEVVLRGEEGERIVRWDSEERALAQVLNVIERGHTPSRVLEAIREDRECPTSFRERYESSAPYREWRELESRRQREQDERRRRNRTVERDGRGLDRGR